MAFRNRLAAGVLTGVVAGTVWLGAQSGMSLRNLDMDAMDKTCKPCEDFYQYSVGKWNENNPIPPSQTRWGKRWAGADGNTEVLKTILDANAGKSFRAGTNEQYLADFYSSCMDTGIIDRMGAKPVEPALKRIAALDSRAKLQKELETLAAAGVAVPFGLAAQPYTDDPKQTIAGVRTGGLSLPDRDYYLKDDARSKATRERYLQHVRTLLKLAGVAGEDKAAAAVLTMETKLADQSLSRVERRDPYKTANHLTPGKLRELTPGIDWVSYFRASGVVPTAVIRVGDLKNMREIDRMMREGSLDDWKAYLAWHVVRSEARDLSEPFQQEMFAFVDKYLGGQAERRPRWKYCVSRTDDLLGEALGKAYVDKVFPPAAKAKMQEMVKFLLAAMKESIEGLDWMTPETKKQALAKLATFDPKVGYPDKWRPYTGLRIQKGQYAENARRAEAFQGRDQLGQIGKATDRTRWGMTTPTSNAYYNPPKNEIVFPAGILVPPMFSVAADDAANYGGIGVVIGHEISHGFDDSGSQYDAGGRLKNWWTPEDRKKFLARAECVVQQFEGYFIEPGVHHNGNLVLGESIGDLAGARIAYLAYMKSLEGKPKVQTADGLTPEQKFFVAWGQARGDSTRPEQQRLMVATDPHPVAKYRVIGPLSNMPEFQAAFGCKAGDAMVRATPCRIW